MENINFLVGQSKKKRFKINLLKAETTATELLNLFIDKFNKNPKETLDFLEVEVKS